MTPDDFDAKMRVFETASDLSALSKNQYLLCGEFQEQVKQGANFRRLPVRTRKRQILVL